MPRGRICPNVSWIQWIILCGLGLGCTCSCIASQGLCYFLVYYYAYWHLQVSILFVCLFVCLIEVNGRCGGVLCYVLLFQVLWCIGWSIEIVGVAMCQFHFLGIVCSLGLSVWWTWKYVSYGYPCIGCIGVFCVCVICATEIHFSFHKWFESLGWTSWLETHLSTYVNLVLSWASSIFLCCVYMCAKISNLLWYGPWFGSI